MTTPTTPQAAAFIEATQAFVEHLTTVTAAGLQAHRDGNDDTAKALLEAVEAEISGAAQALEFASEVAVPLKFDESLYGAISYLTIGLDNLASCVDGDGDMEIAS